MADLTRMFPNVFANKEINTAQMQAGRGCGGVVDVHVINVPTLSIRPAAILDPHQKEGQDSRRVTGMR